MKSSLIFVCVTGPTHFRGSGICLFFRNVDMAAHALVVECLGYIHGSLPVMAVMAPDLWIVFVEFILILHVFTPLIDMVAIQAFKDIHVHAMGKNHLGTLVGPGHGFLVQHDFIHVSQGGQGNKDKAEQHQGRNRSEQIHFSGSPVS
jgi:hypothetical protein